MDSVEPFVQVHKYTDGTISYWYVEMDEQDANAINAILERYIDQGFNCRGHIVSVLSDLGETLEEVDGWA